MFWLVWQMLLPYAHHLVCFQAKRSLVVAPVIANGALQEIVVSSFIIFASLLLSLQDCKSFKENNYAHCTYLVTILEALLVSFELEFEMQIDAFQCKE